MTLLHKTQLDEHGQVLLDLRARQPEAKEARINRSKTLSSPQQL